MTRWSEPAAFGASLSILVVLLVSIFEAVAAPPPAAPPPPGPEAAATADPLLALNAASRAAYRRAKDAALARSGPVILVRGDDVVLRAGSRRDEVHFTPDEYHSLKAVSHIPLALDVTLGAVPEGERLGDERVSDLRRYRGLVTAAREAVGLARMPPAQAQRQQEIIARSLSLIDALIASGTCERDARIEYARQMAPLVMANAADAAQADLDGLDRVVRNWKREMPPREWDRLTVIVMGSALPRKDNSAVQYFSRLLGEPGEGRRIVYTESVFDESKALDQLATRRVDTHIGEDFFDDPTRMHRDLLGDAARDYLNRRFAPRAGTADQPK